MHGSINIKFSIIVRLNKLPSSVVMNIREIRGRVKATDDMIDMLIFLTPSLKAILLQIYSELSDCLFTYIALYTTHVRTFPTTISDPDVMEITNFIPNPLPSTAFTLPFNTVLSMPAITSCTSVGSHHFGGT
jgi:hypothetical protein